MRSRRQPPIPQDPLVSVAMPVYNERTTVDAIIRRSLAVPLRLPPVVDDDPAPAGTT